jgi:pimeloyl-ACP methyl ester carboxylesterase
MSQAIVIVGGYGSLWPIYLKMARYLEDISGLPAVGTPLAPWHWWAANREQDATNILRQLEDTVAWARRRLQADRFILVGHSAGGVVARLYLHEGPVWGHVYAGVEHVTAVITLGSPHCGDKGADTGWFLTDKANQLVLGAFYHRRVCYRTVAGRYIQGRRWGRYRERRAFRNYRFFAERGNVWGDGTVPLSSAGLEGAEPVVLEGVGHSRKTRREWYGGSKDIIHRWWPDELEHAD